MYTQDLFTAIKPYLDFYGSIASRLHHSYQTQTSVQDLQTCSNVKPSVSLSAQYSCSLL